MAMRSQRMTVTRGSRVLAILGSIIRFVELDAEELNVDDVMVCFPSNPNSYLDLMEEVIEVRVTGAPWVEDGEINLDNVDVRISVKRGVRSGYCLTLRDLYVELPKITIVSDLAVLKPLSYATSRTGVEYMVLYREEGYAILLEGERLHVTIPYLESLGVVHTHPEGSCAFSEADIRSATYTLSDLALFEAIVTPTCSLYIARIGFLDEHDFEKLLNHRGVISEPLRLNTIMIERIMI